jgi:hypothetical protein
MKWALNRERGDHEKFVVTFADLTKEQAKRLLLAYLEAEKANVATD